MDIKEGWFTSDIDFWSLTHSLLALCPHPRLTDMPLPVPSGMTAAGGFGKIPISLHTAAGQSLLHAVACLDLPLSCLVLWPVSLVWWYIQHYVTK